MIIIVLLLIIIVLWAWAHHPRTSCTPVALALLFAFPSLLLNVLKNLIMRAAAVAVEAQRMQ